MRPRFRGNRMMIQALSRLSFAAPPDQLARRL